MLQTAGEEIPGERESPDSLLLVLLQVQNQMKLYHWQTHSHARHRSTDDFVTEFVERLDHFVETYQGALGRRIFLQRHVLKLDDLSHDSVVEYTRQMEAFLRDVVGPAVRSYPDVVNLRDEILGHTHQLLYLFTLE